jgi:hypothetical protein
LIQRFGARSAPEESNESDERTHYSPSRGHCALGSTGPQLLSRWGTFRQWKEPMDEPISRLVAAAGSESDGVVLREIGGTWSMPESEAERRGAARAMSASGN